MLRNRFFTLLLILGIGGCASQDNLYVQNLSLPRLGPHRLKETAYIYHNEIDEASGMVASQHYPGVIWTHNDSGNSNKIYPINKQGTVIKPSGTNNEGITMQGSQNIDWEDIAINPQGYLLIGDFGNNNSRRKVLKIYAYKEPDPHKDTMAPLAYTIPFRFTEQKQYPAKRNNFDCEAMFVAFDKVYLLTKHWDNRYTDLYRFDTWNKDKMNLPTLIGRWNLRGMVTAADALPDGSKLAVLTYSSIWVFEPKPGNDKFFSGSVYWRPIRARQAESICFIDDSTLLIGNEQRQLFELKINKLKLVKN